MRRRGERRRCLGTGAPCVSSSREPWAVNRCAHGTRGLAVGAGVELVALEFPVSAHHAAELRDGVVLVLLARPRSHDLSQRR